MRAFVVHNYVNLNIGLKLTLEQGAAYPVEWIITGIVIGAIYRPALEPSGKFEFVLLQFAGT